ncbi:MAG: PH domain-containing protein, partial [Pygmaiobacter sp.]
MLWRHSGATFETASFSIRFGVFFRRTASYRNDQVSAVVVSRPPFCRICGAAKLTVYFKSEKPLASVNLVLSKDAAATFARRLVPAEKASSCFEPAGFDRLIFVMLSANIIATGALSVMTVYRVSRLLGQDFEAAAWNGLARATHLFSTWLPAGASAFVTLTLFFTLLSLLSSLASTTGFTVERSGAVLLCRGGLFTKTERRIFIASINVSSLHITPWARLLRCYPVYITAGGFRGHELPL